MGTVAIVLAAGQGKRMGDPTRPKVLTPLGDKPLLAHVLDTLSSLSLERTIVVVGFAREHVISYVQQWYPRVEYAIQAEQRGTAHAVLQVAPLLADWGGTVLIVNGDVPLVRWETLHDFLTFHHQTGAALSVLSTCVPDPRGYGRILRAPDGTVEAIVEDADLPSEHRTIAEINTGIYAADASLLFDVLSTTTPTNAQGEYYLTDAVSILRNRGEKVAVWLHPDWEQFLGVNTPEQLRQLELLLQAEHSNLKSQ